MFVYELSGSFVSFSSLRRSEKMLQIFVFPSFDTCGSEKICPLLRGVCYWEVIFRYSRHFRYLGLPLLGGFTVLKSRSNFF